MCIFFDSNSQQTELVMVAILFMMILIVMIIMMTLTPKRVEDHHNAKCDAPRRLNDRVPTDFSHQNLRTFYKLLRTQMTEIKTKNQYASYRK